MIGGPYFVTLTGRPRINGKVATNSKAVELAYLLSISQEPQPYSIRKSTLLHELYGSHCSRNAAWYPIDGCRTHGMEISYDRASSSYSSDAPVVSDLQQTHLCLKEGRVHQAMFFLRGPLLPGISDPFADKLRSELRKAFARTLSNVSFEEEMRVTRYLASRRIA